jgi:HK97 gp10 family phage protein
MSMGANVKTLGVDELRKRMQMLRSYQEVEKIMFRGTYGAATDVRALAIDNARVNFREHTGALQKNIARKKIKKGSTWMGYTVGVRHGTRFQRGQTRKAGRNVNDPWYWWILEFGTNDGRIPPRPFLGKAFKQLQGRSTDVIIKQSMAAVMKSAKAALRKYPDNASISARKNSGR